MIRKQKQIVDIRKPAANIGNAGVGFVVIPDVNNRDEYIEDCYRTNTVTIQGGQGYGFFPAVNVDQEVMQQLHFPSGEEGDNRGTAVVWVKDEITGLPVIVAALRQQDDYYALGENQRRWACSTKNGSVEVFADGEGNLNISITGSKESPASLNIKVSSDNADSVVNLSSDADLNIQADKKVKLISAAEMEFGMIDKGEQKTTLSYKLKEGLKYEDEFENRVTIKDGEVIIESKKISHNSGKEPMVLGDTLAQLLQDLINGVMAITVTTAVGPSGPPNNIATFTQLLPKVQQIKSKKSNLE